MVMLRCVLGYESVWVTWEMYMYMCVFEILEKGGRFVHIHVRG